MTEQISGPRGDRYTRKDGERAFERLCLALDKPNGHYRELTQEEDEGVDELPPGSMTIGDGSRCTIPGGWHLDHNSVYGGYVVEEIMFASMGITHPFGSYRRNAREFVTMVRDVINALTVHEASNVCTPKVFTKAKS